MGMEFLITVTLVSTMLSLNLGIRDLHNFFQLVIFFILIDCYLVNHADSGDIQAQRKAFRIGDISH